MQLDLAGQRTIGFPSAETIAAELRAGAQTEDFFAILSEFDARFIQTAGNHTDGFPLNIRMAASIIITAARTNNLPSIRSSVPFNSTSRRTNAG